MTDAPTLRYGTPEEAGMLPDCIENVKKLAEGWVADGHTPSLVVLATRKGVIFLHEAYGVLTPEEDSPPLQKDSIFPLASITKPITATAAMILVEDGLLGLNRPVVDYIPEVCGKGTEEILVHHLLTHTSGYNEVMVVKHQVQKIKESIETPPCDENQHHLVHELLSLRYSAPLWKQPGVEMLYANMNYLLLGEIIRRVSKQSLADFAKQRIFNPLGMIDTNYIVPESLEPRIVKRSPNAPGAQRISRFSEGLNSRQSRETPIASGGVYSTAMDMTIFGQTFLNKGRYGDVRILSRPTISEMTRNQIPGIGAGFFDYVVPEAGWGYGWSVSTNTKWKYFSGSLSSPGSMLGHPGNGGACLWVDMLNEIVGIYFEVTLEVTKYNEHKWNLDLFQNAITASVND